MNNLTFKEKEYLNNRLTRLFINKDSLKLIAAELYNFFENEIDSKYGSNKHVNDISVYDRGDYLRWDTEPDYSIIVSGTKVTVFEHVNYKMRDVATFDIIDNMCGLNWADDLKPLELSLDDLIINAQHTILDIVRTHFFDSFNDHIAYINSLEEDSEEE